MARRRRVALYGGSFNPPHVCHVLVATWVLCREDVDELRVIPVFAHPFGKALAPYDDRCEMLRLGMAHLGPRVVVDRIESELGSQRSYTIHTVRAMLAKEPDLDLRFVCGTDVYAQRRRWHEWDALDALLDFIVIGREGEPPLIDDDGTEIRPRITLPDVSSTDIRAALAAGDEDGVAGWLPRPVLRFLRDRGLYRDLG